MQGSAPGSHTGTVVPQTHMINTTVLTFEDDDCHCEFGFVSPEKCLAGEGSGQACPSPSLHSRSGSLALFGDQLGLELSCTRHDMMLRAILWPWHGRMGPIFKSGRPTCVGQPKGFQTTWGQSQGFNRRLAR